MRRRVIIELPRGSFHHMGPYLVDNLRILIADDDQNLTDLLRNQLENAGFEVVVAGNAESAARRIRNDTPDLLITNLTLPDQDGIALINLVRRDLQLSRLPIIILSTRATRVDKLSALESGADDYITRPFSPRELVARVRSMLRRSHVVECDEPSDLSTRQDVSPFEATQ